MSNQNQHIILFDGICNLCQRSVQFVLEHDRTGIFSFASLQSEKGGQMAAAYGLGKEASGTFILVENGKAYTRSTAALRVLKQLGFPRNLLYSLILVPAFLRDAVYSWIARNRYAWFGKSETCWLPSAEWKDRFLDHAQ